MVGIFLQFLSEFHIYGHRIKDKKVGEGTYAVVYQGESLHYVIHIQG